MPKPFFDRALAAARISVAAFRAEFNKPDADANAAHEYDGDYLIHKLIPIFPDDVLPALIAVLIENNVNLEADSPIFGTPVALAARYSKKATVDFLIENQVLIHTPMRIPVLCAAAATYRYKDPSILLIIKSLIEEHKVNIDIQDSNNKTALIWAAGENSSEIISCLLSKNANIFLQCGAEEKKTAVAIAYQEYISSRRNFSDMDPYVVNIKACLDLLINAAYQYFYRQGLSFAGTDDELQEILMTSVDALAGNFWGTPSYPSANSKELKTLLIQQALTPAINHLKQRQAIYLGSQKSHAEKTPIYAAFFQNPLFDSALLDEVFTYVHPLKPGA